jgi:hypothetical protein
MRDAVPRRRREPVMKKLGFLRKGNGAQEGISRPAGMRRG